jgi:hypothetical protein
MESSRFPVVPENITVAVFWRIESVCYLGALIESWKLNILRI